MIILTTNIYLNIRTVVIGFIEELPGANTQGNTLEEARNNLEEAVQLVLDANRELKE
ncbi:MAG: HicB family protein [Candidatus Brocadia sp. WS118]|nr:MAG: HicB family protein [Candidatus Brocadia sp. WS118]